MNKSDFVVWIVTLLLVIIVDIVVGLGVGIGLSLLLVVFESSLSSGSKMQTTSAAQGVYSPIRDTKSCVEKEVGDIRVFCFNSLLFFPNIDRYRQQIMQLAKGKNEEEDFDEEESYQDEEKPKSYANGSAKQYKQDSETPVRTIICDCSAVSYIDFMALNVLKEMRGDLEELGVTLVLAACRDHVIIKLMHSGFYKKDAEKPGCQLYPTVYDAVCAMKTDQTVTKF